MLKINTKEFKTALKKLEAVKQKYLRKCDIDLGVLIEIKNNILTITSTDITNFLTATINDFECKTNDFKVRITGLKDLKKSFKFFKDNYTYIKTEDNMTIIKNDNKIIKTKYNDVTTFATKDILNPDKIYTCNITGDELLTRIKQVESFRAKKNNCRQHLQGIVFKGYDTIALDGYRIAWSEGNTFFKNEIIINNVCIKTIKKLIKKKDDVNIKYDDKQVIFKFDNLELQCRLLKESVLDYEKLFDVDSTTSFKANVKQLKDNIQFLNTYAKKDKNNVVRWDITKDKLTLTVKNGDEIVNTETNIKNIGSDLKIAFNNEFVLDMLKLIEEDEITLQLSTNISPLIVESSNTKYFILPIKLRDDNY